MYNYTTFLSKKQAEAFHDPSGKEGRVLISLTTPGDPNDPRPHSAYCKPAVLHDDTWKAVLRLEFHDKDPNHIDEDEACGYKLFTEADAVTILNFLKEHEADVDSLIVHCEGGISRSAGVAKFVAHLYSLKFNETYSVYNKHVFSTLMRTYGSSLYGDGPLAAETLPGAIA
jgi:predicted protein tyrosine phosphatase